MKIPYYERIVNMYYQGEMDAEDGKIIIINRDCQRIKNTD